MKLHGWCEKCRKIKRVNVSGASLATTVAMGSGIVTGICDECASPPPKPGGRTPPRLVS